MSQYGANIQENEEEIPGHAKEDENFENNRKMQRYRESWLRWAAGCLRDALQGEPTWHVISYLVDQYDSKRTDWEKSFVQVQRTLPNIEEFERGVLEALDFLEEFRNIRTAAGEILERLGKDRLALPNGASEVSGHEAHCMELLKLHRVKFDGKAIEWRPFFEQFKAIIEDKPIPPVSKFKCLRSVLEGEAKSVIQDLFETTAHYKVACERLEQKYGNPDEIISLHIQGLMQLALSSNANSDSQITALRELHNNIVCHVGSLEALGVGSDPYGLILAPMIVSLLPHDMQLDWFRSGCEKGDLDGVMKFMQREVEAREKAEALKGPDYEKPKDPRQRKRRRKISLDLISPFQKP